MENEMKTRKVEWVEVTEDEYYNKGIDGIERTTEYMGMGYTVQDYYADNGSHLRIEPWGKNGDYYYIDDDGVKHLIIVYEYYYICMNQWMEDEEFVCGSLKQAMKRADKEACYTQQDILIYGDENRENLIAYRRWYGVEPDEDEKETDIISYGKFGYYSEWNEID